ncbi:MAG: PepSY domain-containing protein [Planctomycetota bacterium]
MSRIQSMTWVALGFFLGISGCGGPSETGRATIRSDTLSRYLAQAELDTPYVAAAATGCLNKGRAFREWVKDQKGRSTLATVWIDAEEDNVLHIRMVRTVPCPQCEGTGIRKTGLNLGGIDLMCPRCRGSGVLEDYKEERRFILSEDDVATPRGGRAFARPAGPWAWEGEETKLSPDEARSIADLPSEDAAVRVAALEWLDEHYVKTGLFFYRLNPMLRKASWIETNDKKGVTVYRFSAGKEALPDKADYRIYVDKKTGKVVAKGFLSADETAQNPVEFPEDRVGEKAHSIYQWFTDGWVQ